jgi:hypothetical protein
MSEKAANPEGMRESVIAVAARPANSFFVEGRS